MHKLLATPDKWTKGNFAETPDGLPCKPRYHKACKWCIEGAAVRCYKPRTEFVPVLAKLRAAIQPDHTHVDGGLVAWNDAPERTHAEVLELLQKLDI